MKTATEILAWCVENNDKDDFTIIANYSGHVNMINIYAYVNGYKNSKALNIGFAMTDNQDELNYLFSQLETLKYYNDQSSQWANELAENNKQRKIADLKLKLSELEG